MNLKCVFCRHCGRCVLVGSLCCGTAVELLHTPAINDAAVVRQNETAGDNDHVHEEAVVSAIPSVTTSAASGTTTTSPPQAYPPGFTIGPPIPGAPWASPFYPG
jgi:hypothetical protein